MRYFDLTLQKNTEQDRFAIYLVWQIGSTELGVRRLTQTGALLIIGVDPNCHRVRLM